MLSSFVLKIIAIISMLCDHAGYIIFDNFSFMNYIGRLSFPVFAYLITEGYLHTSNLKKYFIFGVVSSGKASVRSFFPLKLKSFILCNLC